MRAKAPIEIGLEINKLKIIKETEQKWKNRYVLCKCKCWIEKNIRYDHFKGGHTKSCWCLIWKNKIKKNILDYIEIKTRKRTAYKQLAYEVYNNAKICTVCYSLEDICIHHKDKNPWNNKESNLKIICRSCHTKIHMSAEHPNSKRVSQYTKKGEFIKTWDSMADIYRAIWIKDTHTSRVCSWKWKTAWWFKWEYA